MAYEIELPDGEVVEFDDDVKPEDADKFLREQYKPKAFAQAAPQPQSQPQPQAWPGAKPAAAAASPTPEWTQDPAMLVDPVKQTTPQRTAQTAEAAGTAFATSAATLPQSLKTWYYGHRLAKLEQEEVGLAQPTFEAEGQTYAAAPDQQRQERLGQVQKQRREFEAQYGKNVEALNVAQQLVSEARPEDASIAEDAIISFAGSAPLLAAGVGVGLLNPAAGMALGAAGGFAQEAGQTMQEGVAAGKLQDADRAALINGLLEGLGDSVGLKGVFSESKSAFVGFAKALGYEGTQEGVTQFLQDMVSKATYDPEKSWDEVGRNAAVAFLAGAMGGGAAKPLEMAVGAAREQSFNRQMEKIAQQDMERNLAGMPDAGRIAATKLLKPQALPPDYGGLTPENQGYAPGTQTGLQAAEGVVPTGAQMPGGVAVPTAKPSSAFAGPESLTAGGVTTPEQRVFAGQLAQALQQDVNSAVDLVVTNRRMLIDYGQMPLAIANDLLNAGAITAEQRQAFEVALDSRLSNMVQGLMDEAQKLSDERAAIEHKLDVFGVTGKLPLMPYEEHELQMLPEVIATLEAVQNNKLYGADKTIRFGELLAKIAQPFGGVLLAEGKSILFNIVQSTAASRAVYAAAEGLLAARNLAADYQSRKTTGLPFSPNIRNDVMDVGLTDLGTIVWAAKEDGPNRLGEQFKTKTTKGGAWVINNGSPPLSDRQKALLVSAARVARKWMDKLGFEDVAVVLEGESNPRNWGSMLLATKDTIRIKMRLEDDVSQKGAFWPTLAHEVGHGIVTLMLWKSSIHTQKAILNLWAADIRKILNSQADANSIVGDFRYEGFKGRELFGLIAAEMRQGVDPLRYSPGSVIAYHFSFTEWLAQQFELLYAADFESMQQDVADEMQQQGHGEALAFIKQAYKRLRELWAMATRDTPVRDTFQEFMKMHIVRAKAERAASAQWQTQNEVDDLMLGKKGVVPKPLPVETIHHPVPPLTGAPGAYASTPGEFASIGDLFGKVLDPQMPKDGGQFSQDLDKFSWMKRWFQGILDIARVNPHIKELRDPFGVADPITGEVKHGYLDYVIKWTNERMAWVERADTRLRQWRALSREESRTVTMLLLDQTEAGKWFDLQDPAVQKKYPLSAAGLQLYKDVVEDFGAFNREMEATLIAETLKRRANNPFVAQEIQQIRKQFEKMRRVPYFPMSRFGKWVVIVYDKNNKAIDVRTVDLLVERELLAAKLRKTYPGLRVKKSKTKDVVQAFGGFRPELLDAMKGRLQLTPDQATALDQYILELAPAQSFRKHLMERKKTKGFSYDGQRAYADYFQKGAGHIARVKYGHLMQDARNRLGLTASDPQAADSATRVKLYEYVARHYDYVINPQNEWAGFRAAVAVLTLGAALVTAGVNLSQVPAFTYPHLAAKFGDRKALAALSRAYRDVVKMYRVLKKLQAWEQEALDKWIAGTPLTDKERKFADSVFSLSQEERDALVRAQREALIDQSFAMELAAMAEGSWLNKFSASSELGYWSRWMAHGIMVPFELAERLNRRVSFLAAFRLAYEGGLDADTAYGVARDAVNASQFEYGKWNRPELIRGKKGTAFMFMQYQFQALRFLMGGDDGWWRAWAVLLFMSGLMGLPFAEDLMDFATWLISGTNVRRDSRQWLKEQAAKLAEVLHVSPDLLLHGTAHYGFGLMPGADISGPMSMGDVLPFTDILANPGKWEESVLQGAREGGGAVSNLILNAMRGATDETLPMDRRIELMMPARAVRNALTGARWAENGGEMTYSGALIYETNPWEIALKTIGGAQPTGLTQVQEERRIRQNLVKFYEARQQVLLAAYDRAREAKDAEQMALAREAIRQYNEDVPAARLKITGEQIQRSLERREKDRRETEGDRGGSRIEQAVRGLTR